MIDEIPTPLREPNIAEQILNFFIDHKLLDGEIILLKYQLLFLPKNGCGPATSLKVAKLFGNIFLIFVVDNKLHDTIGILILN